MTDREDLLVKVDNVDKAFRRGSEEIHVLGGLNLEIPKGEFLALMDPSGSGKSTLLNLIGGLDRPSQGTIDVGGERTWEFDLVGIYEGAEKGTDTTQFLFRYDFFEESRQFGNGRVGWYTVRIEIRIGPLKLPPGSTRRLPTHPSRPRRSRKGLSCKVLPTRLGTLVSS